MANRACILLFVLCIQFDPSLQQRQKLRKRLDYMEVMLNSLTLKNIKTQFDISELRDAIELLNNKTEGDSSVHTCADVSPLDAAAIADLESEMKKTAKQQDLTIAAIAKAVSDEKKYTRQQMEALDIVSETIANQSNDEIKSDLMEMNSTLKDDIQEVKSDLMEMNSTLKDDIQEVKSELIEMNSTLKDDIQEVKSELMEMNNKLKEDVQEGKSDLMEMNSTLKDDIQEVKFELIEMNNKLKEDVQEGKSELIEMNNKLKEYVQEGKSELMETKEMNSKLKKEVEENKKEMLELRQMIMEMKQTKNERRYSSAVPVSTHLPSTAVPVSTHLPSTAVPVPVHLPRCQNGWVKFQDTCYLRVRKDRVTWDVAHTRCAERGGILAEPDTEEKMRYLLKTFPGGYFIWIGGTDRQTEGTWVWSSSKKNITFFLWGRGQPDNGWGDQDCMYIRHGHLYDVGCRYQRNYICEKKATVQ